MYAELSVASAKIQVVPFVATPDFNSLTLVHLRTSNYPVAVPTHGLLIVRLFIRESIQMRCGVLLTCLLEQKRLTVGLEPTL